MRQMRQMRQMRSKLLVSTAVILILLVRADCAPGAIAWVKRWVRSEGLQRVRRSKVPLALRMVSHQVRMVRRMLRLKRVLPLAITGSHYVAVSAKP